MDYKITGFHPESLFHYFEEISAIPRGSQNEKKISDYLIAFAQKRKLEYTQDAMYNVVIKKPASPGKEHNSPVMLQGHQDMVCEKNKAVSHDFETDGINLIVKDGFVRADGTTLGADNGIAVAMMLAILDDSTLCHPPLECVFTVQEEIGLTGAAMLNPSLLSARTMINLDSEEEGVATVSCAGGLRMELYQIIQRETMPHPHLLEIHLTGLNGGHSGTDIGTERGNANKLMGRLLYHLLENSQMKLVSVLGGNKDNAIPRECTGIVAFSDRDQLQKAKQILDQQKQNITEEIIQNEPNFMLNTVESRPEQQDVLSDKDAKNLIYLLYLSPNDVQKRNIKQGGFIVSSLNLGVVNAVSDRISVVFSPRSSVSSLQEETKTTLSLLARLFEFQCDISGEYPGWQYAEHSKIRDICCSCYQELFHQKLQIRAIHAGLECGLFSDKLPGLDAIAVGPSMTGCHTPDETLDLKSCERTWTFITTVLEKL